MARAIQRRCYMLPRWPACAGLGGRTLPEWVAGIDRNRWPRWAGIRTVSTFPLISSLTATLARLEKTGNPLSEQINCCSA